MRRLGLIFVLMCSSAWADSLTYTGLDFTSVSGGYATSDHLSITLDLADPLTSNLHNVNGGLADVALTGWDISDGLHAFSSATSPECANPNDCLAYAQFTTDANGAITAWHVRAWDDPGNAFTVIETWWFFDGTMFQQGDMSSTGSVFGAVGGAPGSWSVPSSPELFVAPNTAGAITTPEPLTLSLLGLSLVVIAVNSVWLSCTSRRRKCSPRPV